MTDSPKDPAVVAAVLKLAAGDYDMGQLNDVENEFLNGLHKRATEYGDRMFVSEKQGSWFRDIYQKVTGEAV